MHMKEDDSPAVSVRNGGRTASSGSDGAGFDVVVIGSGVGGLCAAALLADAGQRVLVVERDEFVGGRISTRDVDGFRRPEGGVALELGGSMEEIFRTVGARYDVRECAGVVIRAGGRSIDTGKPITKFLMQRIALPAARLGMRLWRAPADGREPTMAEWLSRFTQNPVAHGLARNLAAGVFGLNADEVAARALLTYLTQKSAFRRYGYSPRGSIGPMEELARVVRENGGEVWTSATALRIETADGRAVGLTLERDGQQTTVDCRAVVSNAGPAATVELLGHTALPEDYLQLIRARDLPRPMIVVDIASRGPLLGEASLVFFGDTSRLAALAHVTSTCPEVAPIGWRLYTAYGVPVPAMGAYDAEAEIAQTLRELREQLSNFDDAKVMRTRLISGDWPAMRTACGLEAPMDTPFPNVWNVGDGVREYADGGMQASATTGRIVAERLLAQLGRSSVTAQAIGASATARA
jgi:phytoene desaturase